MSEPAAIALSAVSKTYRLYGSRLAQALDVVGLGAPLSLAKRRYTEFQALKEVDLRIKPGERVGIIGRNGAGKTTLLKIIAGVSRATAGRVDVAGRVQALMSVGLGFHPEFSGLENIRASLAYNGLAREELKRAVDDVVEFSELDGFLHQPLRTYSLGMQSRLMFATATAIRPEILIVDEVLGAGDAYFSAKSALRIERLARSGCTLILVSHSMQQILQFCQRVIWLESGGVALDGAGLPVVKAYEEFIERMRSQQGKGAPEATTASAAPAQAREAPEWFVRDIVERALDAVPIGHDVAEGGVSRWRGGDQLRIADFRILDGEGRKAAQLTLDQPVSFEIDLEAAAEGTFPVQLVVLVFAADGRPLVRHLSPLFTVVLRFGERVTKLLSYTRLLMGNGEYVISVAAYRAFDPRNPAAAQRYDLVSRSYRMRVVGGAPLDPSVFHHPASWLN